MNSPLRRTLASSPHSTAFPDAAAPHHAGADPVPMVPGSPVKPGRMMRKFEVSALTRDGTLRETSHIVPAHPLFEDAVSAFVRGTIIQTDSGPMAVEDLLPGDHVVDLDGVAIRVMWIGATMIVPGAEDQRDTMRHTWRITADKFGVGRPMPDLMLAQGARLLIDRPGMRDGAGEGPALVPIADLADDMGLIRLTPPSPVRVFHLVLEHHAAFRAAGLEVESYHPGPDAPAGVGANLLSLWLSLFPHVDTPQDFGPLAHRRASARRDDLWDAA